MDDLGSLVTRINRASQSAHAHKNAVVMLRTVTTFLFLASFVIMLLVAMFLAPKEVEIREVDPDTGKITIRYEIVYFDVGTMTWQTGRTMSEAEENGVSAVGCMEWTAIFAAFMTVSWLVPASRSQNLSFLDELQDPRAAGDLAQLLESKDPDTRRAVTAALARLLPKVTQEQIDELDAAQRTFLRRAIRIGAANEDCAFQMAAIHTLAQSGDSYSVPILRGLASTITVSNPQERVRAVAVQCLPGLLRAVEERKHRLTLLRPVEAADALVRTADAPTDSLPRIPRGGNTDPAPLLRPTDR
jgi:hypothetical protein